MRNTLPHPGAYVRANIIGPLELTVGEAATVLGVTRQALSSLLNGHVSLTPEMALRIEKAFGTKMDELVQMQTACDIAETRARQNEIKVHRFASKMRPGG